MVTVRVPATTANLGPGFDTLGLALALYNTLTFEDLPQGLFFEGVEPEYATVENLAVVSYKAVLSKLGLPMPGLRISIQAEIPICRGLGSSAALIAAGAAGANANHGSPLSRAELLAVCEGMHYALVALHVRVQTAVAYERLGKHENARAWLADALRDAEPDGLVMPFVENYGYLAPLLSREVRSGLTARIIELGEAAQRRGAGETLPAVLAALTAREVEVVRLLVHDSIEEQVVSMSQAKRKLFDLLITPGESMPTKLSDEDLLKLFEIK